MSGPVEETERIRRENLRLTEERALLIRYLRQKTDELLVMMRCPTMNADGIDDMELIGYDPIGTIASSFSQVLENLHRTNERLLQEAAERARVEGALRESEERLRDFFENATELIQIVAPDGRFQYVNRKWLETLGYSEAEASGMVLTDVVAPEHRDACREFFRRLLSGDAFGRIETCLLHKGGARILAEGNANCRFEEGRCVAVRMICRDVTAQRKYESELLKAEKLESIGVLAGGIAHDFNNLLTGVLGNISMARIHAAGAGEAQASLARAEKACLRARELTRQLLTFSEGGGPVRKAAPVQDLLRNSAEFALRGSNVRCEIHLPDDLSPVDIDEVQIAQVFHNLVLNADQAMPDGGTVRLSAENVAVEGRSHLPLKPGRYVRVAIADSGVGIPKEALPKVFDPFYTTKEKGSGLGLATAYSVLKQHDGLITVESEPGKGTIFHVYLPASKDGTPREETAAESHGGKRRVLVMDDEEMVREVAAEFLGHLGYDAAAAGTGEEALEAYRAANAAGQPFAAVIMDLTIPGGMGGKEAVRHLLEFDPAVRAIVSSGYSTDPVMSDHERYGFRGVIAKPYRIRELREVLDAVLAGNSPGKAVGAN